MDKNKATVLWPSISRGIMSNSFSPFGFSPSYVLPGMGADFGMKTRLIKGTGTVAVYRGDVLAEDPANPGFLLPVATPGTEVIKGIAWGFQWQQPNGLLNPWNPYWPGGSTITGDVSVLIVDNPNAIFKVQGNTTLYGNADLDKNVQFANGTGNTANGISGAYVTGASATTSTLPFRIVTILGVPVTDNTSSYQLLEVCFNNQSFKQLVGGN